MVVSSLGPNDWQVQGVTLAVRHDCTALRKARSESAHTAHHECAAVESSSANLSLKIRSSGR